MRDVLKITVSVSVRVSNKNIVVTYLRSGQGTAAFARTADRPTTQRQWQRKGTTPFLISRILKNMKITRKNYT